MRQTIQLAGLLAQKHHGRGSRPGGTAVAPNMLSSLGGGVFLDIQLDKRKAYCACKSLYP